MKLSLTSPLPLEVCLEPHFKAAEIDVDDISYNTLLAGISSLFVPISVMRFGLTKLKKLETNPEQYKQLFLPYFFPNHCNGFTNGSKSCYKVAAAAAVHGNFQNPLLYRLLDNCFYTAELHAAYLALKLICQFKNRPCLVYFLS